MLRLSQTAGYAVHALSCLEESRCEAHVIRDVAQRAGIPRSYLAKILNELVRQGLIVTKRGHGGGIALARPPQQITLLEVVQAMEGKDCTSACLFGLHACPAPRECPIRRMWHQMRGELEQMLGDTTLAEVIDMLKRTEAHARPGRTCGESHGRRAGDFRGVRRPLRPEPLAAVHSAVQFA